MRLNLDEIEILRRGGISVKRIAEIEEVSCSAIFSRCWRANNLDFARESAKKWRTKNPHKWRKNRNGSKKRRQLESFPGAKNRYQKWTPEDAAYLKEYGRIKTIAQLAKNLGRTHVGVQMKAHALGISLKK